MEMDVAVEKSKLKLLQMTASSTDVRLFLLSTYGTETLPHAQSLLLIKKLPISLVVSFDG